MKVSLVYLNYKLERKNAKLLKRLEKKKVPKKSKALEAADKEERKNAKLLKRLEKKKVPKKSKALEAADKEEKKNAKLLKRLEKKKKSKAPEATVERIKVQQSVPVSLPVIHFINQQTKKFINNATQTKNTDNTAQLQIPESVINLKAKTENNTITKKLRQIRLHNCEVSTNKQDNNTNEPDNIISNKKILQDQLFLISKKLAGILKNGINFLKSDTNKNNDGPSQPSESSVLKHQKVTVPVKRGIHCTENAVVELRKKLFYTKEAEDGQSDPKYIITRYGLKILDLLVEHGKTHKLQTTDQLERSLKNYKQITKLLAAEDAIINLDPIIISDELNQEKNDIECHIIESDDDDDPDQNIHDNLKIVRRLSEENKFFINVVQKHINLTNAIYNNQQAKPVSTQAGNDQSDEVNLNTLAETANCQNKLMLPPVVKVLKKDCQSQQNQLAQKQWEKAQELQSHEQRMNPSQLLPLEVLPSQSQPPKSHLPQSLLTQPKPHKSQPQQLLRIQPSQPAYQQPAEMQQRQVLPPQLQPQQLHPTQQRLQLNYPQPTQMQQSLSQLRVIQSNPPQTQLPLQPPVQPLQPPVQPLQPKSSHLPLIRQTLSYYTQPAQLEPKLVQPTQRQSTQLPQMHPNPSQKQLQLQQPPKPQPPRAEPPQQQLFYQCPYPQPNQMPYSHMPTVYEPQQWQQYNYVQQQQYGQQNAQSQYTPRQHNYPNVYRTQYQKPIKENGGIYLHPGDPIRPPPPQTWSTARARPDYEVNNQHAYNAQCANYYPEQMQGNNPNHYW